MKWLCRFSIWPLEKFASSKVYLQVDASCFFLRVDAAPIRRKKLMPSVVTCVLHITELYYEKPTRCRQKQVVAPRVFHQLGLCAIFGVADDTHHCGTSYPSVGTVSSPTLGVIFPQAWLALWQEH
jgi:hypothetical protein